jgi:hypothetical protein
LPVWSQVGATFFREADMQDEDTKGRTAFARATREYDPEFEHAIAAAVSAGSIATVVHHRRDAE